MPPMAEQERLQISPKVLRWARERAGMDVETLSRKVSKRYPLWEAGEALPTVRQLDKVAKVVRVAYGSLLLSEPPNEDHLLPDLRTVGSQKLRSPSPELLDTIYQCLRCQGWYNDHLVREGYEPLGFVRSATTDSDPETVAGQIRKALSLDSEERASLKTWEEALSQLVTMAEQIGVMVMINGIVKGNTRRALDVEEFRGLAIADDHAPLVFINGKDSKSAQMFTLAHELAHIWLGQSGVSNATLRETKGTEAWCNKVAARTLVPTDVLVRAAGEIGDQIRDVAEAANTLARRFKVSRLVVIISLREAGLISGEGFFGAYQAEVNRLADLKKSVPRGFGQNSKTRFRQLTRRCGYKFSRAVISSTLNGETVYTRAMRLLGIRIDDIDDYARQFGLTR